MSEFIKLKNEAKKGALQKKGGEDLPKRAKRPYKELPEFRLREGEKPRQFLNRVRLQTQANMKEAQFEAKYGVDVVRKENGDVQVKKRSEEELMTIDTDLATAKSKKRRNKGGKGGEEDEERPIAAKPKGIQRRKERFDKKKLKREKKSKLRQEKLDEHNQMYKRDDIKFGEVAHCPPQLKVPRLAQAPETVPRPGKKPLLLHSIVNANQSDKGKLNGSADIGIKLKTGKIDLKGKRKDLPLRTKEMLERDQQSVIDQYRQLKKKRMAESNLVPI